jgi:hypothetical protein
MLKGGLIGTFCSLCLKEKEALTKKWHQLSIWEFAKINNFLFYSETIFDSMLCFWLRQTILIAPNGSFTNIRGKFIGKVNYGRQKNYSAG